MPYRSVPHTLDDLELLARWHLGDGHAGVVLVRRHFAWVWTQLSRAAGARRAPALTREAFRLLHRLPADQLEAGIREQLAALVAALLLRPATLPESSPWAPRDRALGAPTRSARTHT